MRLGILRWISGSPSGGNRYDTELVAGLRTLSVEVREIVVQADLDNVPDLRAEAAAAFPQERRWLVDGIVAGVVPDLVAAVGAQGASVVVLVHHFGADAPELSPAQRSEVAAGEAAALRAARGVLCTSQWAASELARRYEVHRVGVARPGVEPAAVAPGSRAGGVPHLLSVGSLTPIKDQLTFVAALRHVADLEWTAALLGDAVAPEYARAVRTAVRDAGLGDRVRTPGVLEGAALDTAWAGADLLVQTSRSETYGLVVTEALARGIPAVVSDGTGLVEAWQIGRRPGDPSAGATFRSGDPVILAAVLRDWLGNADLAARWRTGALEQRTRLPGWTDTASAALAYLTHPELRPTRRRSTDP